MNITAEHKLYLLEKYLMEAYADAADSVATSQSVFAQGYDQGQLALIRTLLYVYFDLKVYEED